MIFFHIDITELCDFASGEKGKFTIFQNSENAKYLLSQCNTLLLDAYEGNDIPFLLQFARIDTDSIVLAYAAYEPQSIVDGTIDVGRDVKKALDIIKFPAESCYSIYHEISASDFSRALRRYDMECYRLREICSKKFGLDFWRYDNSGYVVSDRVVEDGLITDEKTATTVAKKLLPDATLVDEINRIFRSSHPRDTFYGIPVHYKISVKSDFVADEMVDLLVGCLYGSTLILPQEVPFVYCPFLLDLFKTRPPYLFGENNFITICFSRQ